MNERKLLTSRMRGRTNARENPIPLGGFLRYGFPVPLLTDMQTLYLGIMQN